MTLRDLQEGDWAKIIRVRGRGPFRRRLMEMGFVPGSTVFVEKYAPLRDPVEFVIMGYHVSLRMEEAAHVEVIRLADKPREKEPPGVASKGRRRRRWRRR